MEENGLTLEDRKILDFYLHCRIQELTDSQLLHFRRLLEKHQLSEVVQCRAS